MTIYATNVFECEGRFSSKMTMSSVFRLVSSTSKSNASLRGKLLRSACLTQVIIEVLGKGLICLRKSSDQEVIVAIVRTFRSIQHSVQRESR